SSEACVIIGSCCASGVCPGSSTRSPSSCGAAQRSNLVPMTTSCYDRPTCRSWWVGVTGAVVIQQAHEYCKTLGRKLEAELKSIVISGLIAIKRLRAAPSDVEVRPVGVRHYLERFARATAAREQEHDGETRLGLNAPYTALWSLG